MILSSAVKIQFRKKDSPELRKIEETTYIVSPLETLSEIEKFIREKKPGSYMRFGDGDVFLSIGSDDAYQVSGAKLKQEMTEAFSLKGPGILKSLSIHSHKFGYEKEMFPGNHLSSDEAATSLLKQVYPYFVGYRVFSPVALHYAASYHPLIANDFLKLLKQQAVLLIGNENIPATTVQKLFAGVEHVKTPAQNAYDDIDRIQTEAEQALDNNRQFGIVIVSMGCSGRVLLKRLQRAKYNVFFFDFGSLLDGICGDETRTWLKEVAIDYEVLLKDL